MFNVRLVFVEQIYQHWYPTFTVYVLQSGWSREERMKYMTKPAYELCIPCTDTFYTCERWPYTHSYIGIRCTQFTRGDDVNRYPNSKWWCKRELYIVHSLNTVAVTQKQLLLVLSFFLVGEWIKAPIRPNDSNVLNSTLSIRFGFLSQCIMSMYDSFFRFRENYVYLNSFYFFSDPSSHS